MDKLPTTRGTKVGKSKENINRLSNLDETDILDDSASQANAQQLPSQKVIGGITYRQLKPEVKQTLDKVVYQLELVAKTLQLMEQRVIDSEDKLQEVMTFLKHNDLSYVSNFPQHSLNLFHIATGNCEQSSKHEQVR